MCLIKLKRCKWQISFILIIALVKIPVCSTQITLQNGTKFKGEIVKEDEQFITINVKGSEIKIMKSLIVKLYRDSDSLEEETEYQENDSQIEMDQKQSEVTEDGAQGGVTKKVDIKEIGADMVIPGTEVPDTSTGPGANLSHPSATKTKAQTAKEAEEDYQRLLSRVKTGKRKVIAGNIMFFSGLTLNYSIIPLASNLDLSEPKGLAILLATVFSSSGLKIAGTPISCAGGTKVERKFRRRFSNEFSDLHVWRPFALGWICGGLSYIVGIIRGVVSDNANSSTMTTLNIAFYTLGGARDVLWSTANIKSAIYVGKASRKVKSSRVSVIPYFDINGRGGLSLSLKL